MEEQGPMGKEDSAQLSEPVRLRLLKSDKRLADQLAELMGESDAAAILRRAISKGLLLEAADFPSDEEGKCGPIAEDTLARKLRRILATAIDVMATHQQLPRAITGGGMSDGMMPLPGPPTTPLMAARPEKGRAMSFDTHISDDMEGLGIGGVITSR